MGFVLKYQHFGSDLKTISWNQIIRDAMTHKNIFDGDLSLPNPHLVFLLFSSVSIVP